MKKTMLVASIAFFALALAAHGQGKPDARKPAVKERESTQLLRYEISVTNQGTRSEGFNGKIIIAGTEAPDAFAFIEAYGVRYVNVPFTQTWKWHGYTPDVQVAEQAPIAGKPAGRFEDADSERGWYAARVEDMKPGTPASWIFAGSSSEGAWIDPSHFADYCATVKTK